MVIVDVLGLSVIPVVVSMSHLYDGTPLPDIVQVPLPMFKVRVLLLLEEKRPAVTLKFAALKVPCVRVSALEPSVIASASVIVPPALLIVILDNDFPLLVIVPVPTNVKPPYAEGPVADKVRLPDKVMVGLETVLLLPVKFTLFAWALVLNIVIAADPPVNHKFGPTVGGERYPRLNVLVDTILRVKLPVPLHVRPDIWPILNMVAPAVVLVSAMLPEPKLIARVVVVSEEKLPVLNVNPARARVPELSVVEFVIPVVSASASVTVVPEPLTARLPRVLPALVIVPVAISDSVPV